MIDPQTSLIVNFRTNNYEINDKAVKQVEQAEGVLSVTYNTDGHCMHVADCLVTVSAPEKIKTAKQAIEQLGDVAHVATVFQEYAMLATRVTLDGYSGRPRSHGCQLSLSFNEVNNEKAVYEVAKIPGVTAVAYGSDGMNASGALVTVDDPRWRDAISEKIRKTEGIRDVWNFS